MIYLFFTLCVIVTAGLIARWDGSKDGRGAVKALAWGAFFTLPVVAIAPAFIPVTLALCSLGQAAPTGAGLRMGRNSKIPVTWNVTAPVHEAQFRKVETIEWPQYAIFWKDGSLRWISSFWYDFIYMAVKGFLAVSGVVVALATINVWAALLMALAAIFAPLAYELGWRVFPSGKSERTILGMNEATQIGEAGRGAMAGLFLMLALAVL